jgi:Leucine-rich repeat (LRR) protein
LFRFEKIPDFSPLTRLKYLGINYNQLVHLCPSKFLPKSLLSLDLSFNYLNLIDELEELVKGLDIKAFSVMVFLF